MAKRSKVIDGIDIPEGGDNTPEISDIQVSETADKVTTNMVFAVPSDLASKFSGLSHSVVGQDPGTASPVNMEALKNAGLTSGDIGMPSLAGRITIVDGVTRYNPKTGQEVKKPVAPTELSPMQIQASGIKEAINAPTILTLGALGSIKKS